MGHMGTRFYGCFLWNQNSRQPGKLLCAVFSLYAQPFILTDCPLNQIRYPVFFLLLLSMGTLAYSRIFSLVVLYLFYLKHWLFFFLALKYVAYSRIFIGGTVFILFKKLTFLLSSFLNILHVKCIIGVTVWFVIKCLLLGQYYHLSVFLRCLNK